MRHGHFGHGVPVIIILSLLCLVLVTFLSISPKFTGNVIVGQGGVITNINIFTKDYPSSWIGIYGNLTLANESKNYSVSGGQVINLNLTYDSMTNNTLVFGSTIQDPDFDSLLPANHPSINAFLGLGSGADFSSENTLTQRVNFSINNVTYELWSATVNSFSGLYQTGALISSGSLIFVTKVVSNGQGFTGEPAHYQLLLPISSNSSTNYTFYVFEDDAVGTSSFSCNASLDLRAVLTNNNWSVNISWNNNVGADSFEVHHITGSLNGSLDFSGAAIESVGSNTYFVDNDNASQRYYKINAISGVDSCLTNETAGTISIDLAPDYNLISTPFSSSNQSVKETLRSIDGSFTSVNEFVNPPKLYNFYIIVGQNVFKNFNTIKPGYGYWVKTNSNTTLRLSGLVEKNLSVDVSPEYNLVGFPVIDNLDSNNTVQHVLSSIDGNYSSINEYNNTAKLYKFYIIVGQNVFKNFNTIKPGYGYWIKSTNNDTIVYSND